jgi:hypothetical protein
MNIHRRENRNRRGAALITVLGFVLIIASFLGYVAYASVQRSFMARKMTDRGRAIAIAEAGANYAYTILSTNFAARENDAAFPDTAYAGGRYDVGVKSVGADKAVICSTGRYGTVQEVAILDVMTCPVGGGGGGGGGRPTNAYGFAILAGGNLTWAGNSDLQMSNGWMHCNGTYSANGINVARGNVSASMAIRMVGGATITGIGMAPSISGGTVGTPVVGPVAPMTIPSIDLTPYYNQALASGQVFASGKAFSGNVTPPGGVAWVNGSMSFGNGVYQGCFIATGAVELKTTGNGTIEFRKVASYPLLVSRDAGITIKQAKMFTFRGLIYCKVGSFDKQGNGDVYGRGSIIAAGNISKNGGWAGMIYEDSTPAPPGGGDDGQQYVVVPSAWQK